MPISIGNQADHGFEQPIGLLSDCHRRIERFLAVQLEVAQTARGGCLDERQFEALEKSRRYFANAAPWHTQDEELSLFPRLQASTDPQVQTTLAQMARLEAQHDEAREKHEKIDVLLGCWLEHKVLADQDIHELQSLLTALQAMYKEHIAFEDHVLFPLAQRVLSLSQIRTIGQEMADRRGVDPQMPPARCKHASANRQAVARISINR